VRLVSILWRSPPGLPGLRPSTLLTFEVGAREGAQWAKWRATINATRILLESPPGWAPGSDKLTSTKRTVYELPRDEAVLRWELDPGEVAVAPREWHQPDEHDPPVREVSARPSGSDAPPAVHPDMRPDPNDPDEIVGTKKRR